MTKSLRLQQQQEQLMLTCILYAALGLVVAVYARDPCDYVDTFNPDSNRLWPNGIITYRMGRALSRNVSLAIEKEIQQWELYSCINFVPHVHYDQSNFVFFKPGDKNCAFFGKFSSGIIRLSLSESVSTNQTALRATFARMIGVRNLTMLFNNSLWSHDEMTTSQHSRIKAKKSNPPNAITVENGSLCHKIKTCGYTFKVNSDNKQHHVITSPGYPHGYENNLDCAWSIYNTDQRPLNITLKESFLEGEDDHDCVDYVKIIQMNEEGNQIAEFKRLCGDVQEVINTNAYKIVIWFHSDKGASKEGFIANITWQELLSIEECTLVNGGCQHICIPASESNSSTRTCKCNPGFKLSVDDGASCKDINECKVSNGGCSQICVNTMGGHYCKCQLGYYLIPGTKATHCQRCGETYTDQELVEISSPHYPGVHTAHHNCIWRIKTMEPQFYKLNFTSFDLSYSSNCSLGYLKITDKTNKLKLPRLCGAHHKILIVSRTAELMIHFKTKVSGGTGFHLIYQQVERQQRYIQIDDNKYEGSIYNP